MALQHHLHRLVPLLMVHHARVSLAVNLHLHQLRAGTRPASRRVKKSKRHAVGTGGGREGKKEGGKEGKKMNAHLYTCVYNREPNRRQHTHKSTTGNSATAQNRYTIHRDKGSPDECKIKLSTLVLGGSNKGKEKNNRPMNQATSTRNYDGPACCRWRVRLR